MENFTKSPPALGQNEAFWTFCVTNIKNIIEDSTLGGLQINEIALKWKTMNDWEWSPV